MASPLQALTGIFSSFSRSPSYLYVASTIITLVKYGRSSRQFFPIVTQIFYRWVTAVVWKLYNTCGERIHDRIIRLPLCDENHAALLHSHP